MLAGSCWVPHQTGSVVIYTNILILFPLISRVCICGYPRQQMRRYKGINTRLTVTSDFLVQLITGIHYALYGHTQASMWPSYYTLTDQSASVYTSHLHHWPPTSTNTLKHNSVLSMPLPLWHTASNCLQLYLQIKLVILVGSVVITRVSSCLCTGVMGKLK